MKGNSEWISSCWSLSEDLEKSLDYSVPLFQLDRNLASDILARSSGRPHLPLRKRRMLSSYQVETREKSNLLRHLQIITEKCPYIENLANV